MLRHWRACLKHETAKKQAVATTGVLQDEIARLPAENKALRQAGGGSTFTAADTPEQIARAFVGDLRGASASKLKKIAVAVTAEVEGTIRAKKRG